MSTSATELILAAALTALNGGSKPSGLTVHRQRALPIEADALPAAVLYALREDAALVAQRARVSRHEIQIAVELRAKGNDVPDTALDPYRVWTIAALMADQTLGGTCFSIEYTGCEWDAASRDAVYGACAMRFTIRYHTDSLDLTARVG